MDGYTVVLDAPSTPKARIQIAQLGDYSDARYGDFSITKNDVEQWKHNLGKLPGGRALIDLDHRADRSPRNTEAAGWITGIDLDGDTPVAEVEWTPIGKQAIEEQRYLFFSPTYGELKTAQGETLSNVLQGGALTNKPFLDMPALTLASEETLASATRQLESENAERLLDALHLKLLDVSAGERKLAVKEGNALPDGSYPIRNVDQLKAAAHLAATGHGNVQGARKLIRRRAKELGVPLSSLAGFGGEKSSDSRREMDTEVLTLLGLADDTDVNGVVEAIKALQANAETKPEADPKTLEQAAADEGKIVLDTARLTQLERDAAAGREAATELAAQRFDTSFQKALAAGRAIPAQRERLEHFYTLDANSTLKLLDEGPQIVNVKPIGASFDVESGAPAGVDSKSHELDLKVKARLRELGKPISDYPVLLEQMMEEGAL